MEFINVVSIFLVHAVALVALQVVPTRFLNRAHKVEQVDTASNYASFSPFSKRAQKKHESRSATTNESQPAISTFGKRSLQHALERRRELPRRVLDDDAEYGQAAPTAAEIWTIPSNVPKVKSARLLWYLNDFIPSHPEIDSSTAEGRQKLKAIALEEEKRRKPARIHPISAPKLTSTPVVYNLPPPEMTTD